MHLGACLKPKAELNTHLAAVNTLLCCTKAVNAAVKYDLHTIHNALLKKRVLGVNLLE